MKECAGRIELDPVVMTARDVVWLRLVIQTHDFRGVGEMPGVPLMDIPCQKLQPGLVLYEIPRILSPRVIQPTGRRVTPNETDPPEDAIRHTTCAGLTPSMFRPWCMVCEYVMDANPVQMTIT